jgi:hypothetical protein
VEGQLLASFLFTNGYCETTLTLAEDHKHRPSASTLNVYRCDTCHAYHVGRSSWESQKEVLAMKRSYAILVRSLDLSSYEFLERHDTTSQVKRRLEDLLECGHLLRCIQIVELIDGKPSRFFPLVSFTANVTLESPSELADFNDFEDVIALLDEQDGNVGMPPDK